MADRRDYGIVVAAAAVAAFAIGAPRSTAPPSTGTAPAAQRSSKTGGGGPSAEGDRPLTGRVLAPLRAGREVSRHEDPNPGPIRKMELKDLEIEFQIATVPDPIESRFGHWFDSTVDAIQLAVETQGYTLDRFYLPWQPSGEEPSRTSPLGGTLEEPDDLPESVVTVLSTFRDWLFWQEPGPVWQAKSSRFPKPPQRHRVEPGVLVFRRASTARGDLDRCCVILLVGESPVSGIHKDAMALALDLVRSYHVARGRPETIRIIGPYFTSGAASLARTLSDWATPQCKWAAWVYPGGPVLIPTRRPAFFVLSGSSISTRPDEFEKACWPALVRFQATVAPTSVLMAGLLDYMRQLSGWRKGDKLGKLAILRESSTTYGARTVKAPKGDKGPKWDTDYAEFAEHVLTMYYPFHISQVAVEYNDRGGDDRDARPTLARPSTRLHVPFDGGGTPDDTVPSLSLKSTSARDEFNIEHILMTLSREGYHDIGIVATDIRDVIFLVGLIREFCPDARIFSLEADLVLTHPDFSNKLRGVLFASPYPLHNATQRWTPFSRPAMEDHELEPRKTEQLRQLFLYVGDQGYYNAVLAHFTEGWPRLKGLGDDPMRKAFNYGPIAWRKGVDNRPPVWITMVGNHGLWPLAYYVPRESAEKPLFDAYTRYVYQGPEDTPELGEFRHPSWSWLSVYFGFSVLILMLCWTSDRGLARGTGRDADRSWVLLYRFWPMRGAARWAQDFYIVLGLWSLAMVSVPIAAIALMSKPEPAGTCAAVPVIFFVFDLAVFALAVTISFDPPNERPVGRWRSRMGRIFLFNVVLAIVAFLVSLPEGRSRILQRWLDLLAAQAHALVLVSVFYSLAARVRPRRAGESPLKIRWVAGIGLLALLIFEAFGVAAWSVPMASWLAPEGFTEGVVHLYVDRATTLTSGVSPVPPLLVLALGLVLSMLCHLRALYLYDRVLVPAHRRWPRPSTYFVVDVVLGLRAASPQRGDRDDARPAKSLALPDIDEPCDEIDELLVDPSPILRDNPLFLMVAGFLLFGMCRLLYRVTPTPDGKLFTYTCVLIICGSFFVVVTAFARFLLIWGRLRALFRALMELPMLPAYDRLPALVGQSYGRYLDRYDPRLSSLRPRVQQLRALLAKDEDGEVHSIAVPGHKTSDPVGLGAKVEADFDRDIKNHEFGQVDAGVTRRRIRRVASYYLRRLRRDDWPKAHAREAFHTDAAEEGDKKKAGGGEREGESKQRSVMHMAEELLAMEFLGIVSQYAAHLRNLASFLALRAAPAALGREFVPLPPSADHGRLPMGDLGDDRRGGGLRLHPDGPRRVPQPRLEDEAEPRDLRRDVLHEHPGAHHPNPRRDRGAVPVRLRGPVRVARPDPPRRALTLTPRRSRA